MKVCTDACIFGAWVAGMIAKKRMDPLSILDIGTGTGVLSLMIAQKSDATIHSVEIEQQAFNQAMQNFNSSAWSNRLTVFHEDVNTFSPPTSYDLIVSNPPFYENDLLSPDKNINYARHDAGLELSKLFALARKFLSSDGCFAILVPYCRLDYAEDLAHRNHFFLQDKLLIKPGVKHGYSRSVLLFGQEKTKVIVKEMIIKREDGKYSEDFISIMKDYYLHL